MMLRAFKVFVLIMCVGALVLSQDTLTNDAIIKMVKAGISETVIVSMVNTQPGNYSTKVDDLIALKQAGVTDKVIAAMAAKAAGVTTASTPSPKADGVAENAVAVPTT